MKLFFLPLLILLFSPLLNASVENSELKKMIGRMLIVGFETPFVDENSSIVQDMRDYNLGGVILFDKFYNNKNRTKNISSPSQLKKLTTQLKSFSKEPLFIALDQEGGRVARLKPKYGFSTIPSAQKISQMPLETVKKLYKKQSVMLKNAGINLNFAPVLDLSLNADNNVIFKLERSFGKEATKVAKYAQILIDAQTKHNIISVAKHFPGHGSSLGDSHKGFVDITHTWNKEELKPYKILIHEHALNAVMTAHVFNAKLDEKYPATLSYKINTELLRKQLGFRGVIISDDMQMKAISAHYSLKQALTLAINSGVDILLFGNQLAYNSTKEIVETIYKEVKNGNIPLRRIIEANNKIANLHTQNIIIHKPIIFTPKRIEMTKSYIHTHYAKNPKTIEITPKIIVLHWTAVMNLKDSFARLKSEKLFSDRKDIAAASTLNVSAHFLIDRDGTIYQLMPDNWMARHVIGLNYSSIGIENVGGEENKKEDLTSEQVKANIALINYLKEKYPTIEYLVGHYEYLQMQNRPLWLERDKGYRTKKVDPGKTFMQQVRKGVATLKLKKPNE
ncbi:glycoside hydrolase family 3 N-terminal domain-containing protein [Sulfurimonas sp.]